MSAPCVMVSSTYYDLRQVRTDLEGFLSGELGYHPLLSEFPSFPIDPDKTAIENCRRRVEQNADILVLVIGGRYGSIDPRSDRSVTNLEYLAARAKGIPIYAFVEKKILAVLPLYGANPTGDFSVVVDNPHLFKFIKDVRNTDQVWTLEFETAQDIIKSLRVQFAHLFQESIRLAAKYRQSHLRQTLAHLGAEAFSLALEQPRGWEYRLFARVLQDEISACRELKLRYRNAYTLGRGERVSIRDITEWSSPRINELERVADVLNRAINSDLPKAFGAPGEPGSVEVIVSTALLIGEAYREALEWSLRVRRTSGHEDLRPVIDALAIFPDDMLTKIESLGDPFLKRIEAALISASPDNPATVDASIVIDLSNTDQFYLALRRLEEDVKSGRVSMD